MRNKMAPAKNKKRKRRYRSALVAKVGGLVAAKSIMTWMHTLDARGVFYDRTVDPAFSVGGPRIYVFWHEYILLPLALRGHCHLSMLLSQHGDADILARIAHHVGFDCVRGSSRRGGARAIMELEEQSRKKHLTITPDGPRGPRRRLAIGPVYLASRLQLPLVVMGFGYDRPWRVNSWDQFAVPRPFSRARAVVGPPMMVPADLDRADLETCRERTERLMNCLTSEAESWAAAGTRKVGEVAIVSQIASAPLPARADLSIPQRIAAARAA
jgi:lysophospholipid acyltransferase (LPLAT)-like uncharacterized protein